MLRYLNAGYWIVVVLTLALIGCVREDSGSGKTSLPESGGASAAEGESNPGGTEDKPAAETSSPASKSSTDSTPSTFIRFSPDGKDAGRLETAVTEYVNDQGVEAILYAAVHIADASYYDELQKDFVRCDAVLYELIAPEGRRPKKGEKSGGIISMIQRGMKRGLQLEFQLEGIDYQVENFVHADLSPSGFQRAQAERGESMLSLMVDLYIEEMKRSFQGKGSTMTSAALLHAAMQPDASRAMKLLLAREMPRIDRLTAGADGEQRESAILTDRNIACMKVFDREAVAGKKRIGIFYGGAHLPDMEQRLLDRGYRKTGERFLSAWDVPAADTPKP